MLPRSGVGQTWQSSLNTADTSNPAVWRSGDESRWPDGARWYAVGRDRAHRVPKRPRPHAACVSTERAAMVVSRSRERKEANGVFTVAHGASAAAGSREGESPRNPLGASAMMELILVVLNYGRRWWCGAGPIRELAALSRHSRRVRSPGRVGEVVHGPGGLPKA